MNMIKIIAGAAALIVAGQANAATTIFTPPNDDVGSVYTSNFNDGWSVGRGVVFQSDTAISLTEVALFQNLENVTLNYTLQTASLTGNTIVAGNLLSSGSRTVTTSGLEFIGFATNVNLSANTLYWLNFSFDGDSKENFFYDEGDSQLYNSGGYTMVDSSNLNTIGNTVLPRIRLTDTTGVAAVPEPATWAMMLVGFGMIGATARYRRRSSKVAYA